MKSMNIKAECYLILALMTFVFDVSSLTIHNSLLYFAPTYICLCPLLFFHSSSCLMSTVHSYLLCFLKYLSVC